MKPSEEVARIVDWILDLYGSGAKINMRTKHISPQTGTVKERAEFIARTARREGAEEAQAECDQLRERVTELERENLRLTNEKIMSTPGRTQQCTGR